MCTTSDPNATVTFYVDGRPSASLDCPAAGSTAVITVAASYPQLPMCSYPPAPGLPAKCEAACCRDRGAARRGGVALDWAPAPSGAKGGLRRTSSPRCRPAAGVTPHRQLASLAHPPAPPPAATCPAPEAAQLTCSTPPACQFASETIRLTGLCTTSLGGASVTYSIGGTPATFAACPAPGGAPAQVQASLSLAINGATCSYPDQPTMNILRECWQCACALAAGGGRGWVRPRAPHWHAVLMWRAAQYRAPPCGLIASLPLSPRPCPPNTAHPPAASTCVAASAVTITCNNMPSCAFAGETVSLVGMCSVLSGPLQGATVTYKVNGADATSAT